VTEGDEDISINHSYKMVDLRGDHPSKNRVVTRESIREQEEIIVEGEGDDFNTSRQLIPTNDGLPHKSTD
jgi:hypothetical protein